MPVKTEVSCTLRNYPVLTCIISLPLLILLFFYSYTFTIQIHHGAAANQNAI